MGKNKHTIMRVMAWLLTMAMLVTTVKLPAFGFQVKAEEEKTVLFPFIYLKEAAAAGIDYYEGETEADKERRATNKAKNYMAKAYFGGQTVDATDYRFTVVALNGLADGSETAATSFRVTLELTDSGKEKYVFCDGWDTSRMMKVYYSYKEAIETPLVPIGTWYYPAFYGPRTVTVDVTGLADKTEIKTRTLETVENAYKLYFGGTKVDENYYTLEYVPASDEVYCDNYHAVLTQTAAARKDNVSLIWTADTYIKNPDNAYSRIKEITVNYIGKMTGTARITTASEDISKVYDGKPAVTPAFETTNQTGENNENVTFEYKKHTDSEYTTEAPVHAGTYDVRVVVAGDDEYAEAVSEPVTYTISKAVPTYEIPTGLTAKCGDVLSSVALPQGFAWADGSVQLYAKEGQTETQVEAIAVYTPEDTVDYEGVPDLKLQVTVGHTYTGKITKEATIDAEGEKTYICGGCGASYKESISKLTKPETPADPTTPSVTVPKKGTTLKNKTAVYKVTKAGKTGGEVAYTKSVNKKAAKVSVPASVKFDGITYKVTSVAANAFSGNKKLTEVTIGKNVKTIGKKAFYKCTKLKTVKIGKNVTKIGDSAFEGCKKLTKVTIGTKVKTIGKRAFYNCTSLKTITIPSKVDKIGEKAFYGCTKLKTITVKTTKLSKKKVGSKAFGKTPAKATVYVPKKKVSVYKKLLQAKGISKKATIVKAAKKTK